MGLTNRYIYGYWKMTAIRFQRIDGSWESERVIGGSSIITESGHITTYTRTSEVGFGYSGQFTVQNNVLIIKVEACSITALENTVITRVVLKATPDAMQLEMHDAATGRHYEMDFNLITRKFNA